MPPFLVLGGHVQVDLEALPSPKVNEDGDAWEDDDEVKPKKEAKVINICCSQAAPGGPKGCCSKTTPVTSK